MGRPAVDGFTPISTRPPEKSHLRPIASLGIGWRPTLGLVATGGEAKEPVVDHVVPNLGSAMAAALRMLARHPA